MELGLFCQYSALIILVFSSLKINGEPAPDHHQISAQKNSAIPIFGHRWKVPEVEIELIPISLPSTNMGSPGTESTPTSNPGVEETDYFWIGKFEVTQAEFKKVMLFNPSTDVGDRHPVNNVLWTDAVEYCQKLTKREGDAGRMPRGYIYRLPTEAEWETACRGKTSGNYSFGDSAAELYLYGNYCDKSNRNKLPWQDKNHVDGFNRSAPVGSFLPNSYGIYDMHGNVWEWCAEFSDNRTGRETQSTARKRHQNVAFLRGGSWYHAADGCQCTNRESIDRSSTDYDFGFRIVLGKKRMFNDCRTKRNHKNTKE